jgi:hypothetical protein
VLTAAAPAANFKNSRRLAAEPVEAKPLDRLALRIISVLLSGVGKIAPCHRYFS